MRCAFYEQTGLAEQVLVVGDVPDPQPATGEVGVRLQWSTWRSQREIADLAALAPQKRGPKINPGRTAPLSAATSAPAQREQGDIATRGRVSEQQAQQASQRCD